MRPHLASLVDDFRAHASETAVAEHRGNRSYRTTYGELAKIAGRFAADLERRGVAPGERVVLWGQNSAEWIGVFFGCLLRGVLVVPLDAAGDVGFAQRVVAETAPKLVVADAKLLEALSDVHSPMSVSAAALLPTDDGEPTTDDVGHLPLETIEEHLPIDPLWAVSEAVRAETPFQIVFTSGTTTEPRGIVHTHRNVLVTLAPIESEIAKYRRFERPFHPLRFLHSLPLSHVFGQFMGLWIPGVLAAEVHFADQLDPAVLVRLIQRERVSVLIAVPRVLHLLRGYLSSQFPGVSSQLDGVERADGRKRKRAGVKGALVGVLKKWWRYRAVHRALGWKFWAVISGGATLPADLEAFWNRMGFALIQGYGMTETAALVTLNHPFKIAPGTIGKPLPGREVKITPEGEILVRGEMLSGATWQGGRMQPREGEWLATGDLAERGAAGDLKFLGRKGDVIVTGAGLNIHPADLEAALAAQAGVRAAAVVGCQMPAGPEPVAVVLSGLSDAELDSAVAAANRGLAEFQQMRRVLRWPEPQFPYTSTGKLLRRRVAEWACATVNGKAAATGAGASPDALLAVIAEITGERAPAAEDASRLRLSEDLHLDSLGRVQLQSLIEDRFAIDVDDDAMSQAETVADLRRLLEVAGESSQVSVVSSQERPEAAVTEQRGAVGEVKTRAREAEAQIYPRWPWSWPVLALRVLFLECVMRPFVWFLAAPRVIYTNQANAGAQLRTQNGERRTPCLLIANHITAYDAALALYALPGPVRRRVACAMSGEMLMDFRKARNQGNWFLNALAPAAYWLVTGLFNAFPLPRSRGFRRSFAHAGEAMDRGYSVLIFPEGTRSHSGGMARFRSGIGLLAQESQVPVVPVALVGMYEAAATGRWFRTGKLEVRVGEAIPVTELQGEPAEIAERLESALRSLLN